MTCIHGRGRSVIDYVISSNTLLSKIDSVEINEDMRIMSETLILALPWKL